MIYAAANQGMLVLYQPRPTGQPSLTGQPRVTGQPSGANNWRILRRALVGQTITSTTAQDGFILAGTKNGIFRSGDEGQTWVECNSGLTQPYIRWLAAHPDHPGIVLAGTEPAAIFASFDGGDSWHDAPEVAQLRDRHQWFLPYSSGAGCVRGFAFNGSRTYAAVEVGGALISNNQGRTWQLVEGSSGIPDLSHPAGPLIHPDVHSIAVHPSSPDLVYAPTGGGFYRSADGGRTWRYLYDCYCRAVWVNPGNPDHIVLGPADNVDSNGRIEVSHDGGETWQPASTGLDVPWRSHMVERFTQVGRQLFAVLSNGNLIAASLESPSEASASLSWEAVLPDGEEINAIAAD